MEGSGSLGLAFWQLSGFSGDFGLRVAVAVSFAGLRFQGSGVR